MKVLSLAVLSTLALLATTVTGCASSSGTGSASDSSSSLGTTEELLSADDSSSQEAEDGAEDGIENGLSGASPSEPGDPGTAADLAAIDLKMKTNPGLYFQPAGCIVSTRLAPGQWQHVFTNCTGPQGKVSYNGTITSTWTVATDALEVKHDANGFVVKGPNVTATFSGSRDVKYTRAGSVVTKHRVGNWTGTIAENSDASSSKSWSHTADFVSTWDASSKCYTRSGTADNTIGAREFGRTVSGYEVCGGLFACPSGGEVDLSRKDGTVNITIKFLGGQDVEITGARGNTVDRKIACIIK